MRGEDRTSIDEASVARALNSAERAVLRRVLTVDFHGASELLAQIDHAVVTRAWGMESASVDIEVDAAVPRADVPNGPVPVRALVTNAEGELIGEILIWVGAGRLAGIEYAWFTDDPPTELPPPEWIGLSPDLPT